MSKKFSTKSDDPTLQLKKPMVDIPEKLSVLLADLPFELRGWNKEFVRSPHDLNNYVSAAYTFYPSYLWFLGGISVSAARIRKSAEDGWIFEEFEENRWKRIGSKIIKRNAMGLPELNSLENPEGEWSLEGKYVLQYGRVPIFKVS